MNSSIYYRLVDIWGIVNLGKEYLFNCNFGQLFWSIVQFQLALVWPTDHRKQNRLSRRHSSDSTRVQLAAVILIVDCIVLGTHAVMHIDYGERV